MKKHVITSLFLLICIKLFSQTVNTPVDHRNPQNGHFNLQYEFGKKYNPELPTVLVIADAQQFYVRKGRIKRIQDELFGDDINVLGIIPRGNNEDLKSKVKLINDGRTDWELAYNTFQSYQFVNDIELVIHKVLKNQKDIYLYGQSGGAFLITEYLSTFQNSKVKKVFIGACVNPQVEDYLGIIMQDNFRKDFLLKNKTSKIKLDAVLKDSFFDRKLVASLFQRQNFFVELSEINNERFELVNHLHSRDTVYVNNLKKEYQIDAINGLFDSEIGISIRVRLFEFIQPLVFSWHPEGLAFYPNLESSYNIAYPLIKLAEESRLEVTPVFNKDNFRKYKGDVFILSGRYDHVADYRSSIYLSGLLENSTLFIADDDHTFKKLKSNNDYAKLIQYFLKEDNHEWIIEYNNYLWTEK